MMPSFRAALFRVRLLCCLALCLCPGLTPDVAAGEPPAPSLDFVTIRLGQGDRAVLVVGGIQGDEPGGFSAASSGGRAVCMAT